MITRTHIKDDAPSTATYSDCERYRYALTRVWDQTAGRVHFCMLNPSTATEVANDPTVERCERRGPAPWVLVGSASPTSLRGGH